MMRCGSRERERERERERRARERETVYVYESERERRGADRPAVLTAADGWCGFPFPIRGPVPNAPSRISLG